MYYLEYCSGQDDIQGNSDYDAATAIWGSNWQMPTADDFRNLISTDYTDGGVWKTAAETGYGIDGLLVTGKGDYAEYSVFFPAAGSYYEGTSYKSSYGTEGGYWSSTPEGEEASYSFQFNNKLISVDPLAKDANGYSFRAILK